MKRLTQTQIMLFDFFGEPKMRGTKQVGYYPLAYKVAEHLGIGHNLAWLFLSGRREAPMVTMFKLPDTMKPEAISEAALGLIKACGGNARAAALDVGISTSKIRRIACGEFGDVKSKTKSKITVADCAAVVELYDKTMTQ
jgi:hypothetical protein